MLCYDNFNKLQGVFYKYCSMDKTQDQKAHQLGTMNVRIRLRHAAVVPCAHMRSDLTICLAARRLTDS